MPPHHARTIPLLFKKFHENSIILQTQATKNNIWQGVSTGRGNKRETTAINETITYTNIVYVMDRFRASVRLSEPTHRDRHVAVAILGGEDMSWTGVRVQRQPAKKRKDNQERKSHIWGEVLYEDVGTKTDILVGVPDVVLLAKFEI